MLDKKVFKKLNIFCHSQAINIRAVEQNKNYMGLVFLWRWAPEKKNLKSKKYPKNVKPSFVIEYIYIIKILSRGTWSEQN